MGVYSAQGESTRAPHYTRVKCKQVLVGKYKALYTWSTCHKINSGYYG